MAVTLRSDDLRRIPLFRNLNESEFRQMIEVIRIRTFSPSEAVLRQGDQSRDLWVVFEGQCEVVRRLKANVGDPHPSEPLLLAVLEPYSHFGEMSFFAPAPHSADVLARSALTLLQITHADYADMIEEGILAALKVAYNVVEELAGRLRRMDDWVSELSAHPTAAATVPEFSRFRNKLFEGWSL